MAFLLDIASSTISRALGKDVPILPFSIGEVNEYNDPSSIWTHHNGIKKVCLCLCLTGVFIISDRSPILSVTPLFLIL